MAGFENDVGVMKNLNFDETAAKPHLGIINAAGKLPIGTGNSFPTPEILAGSLTSPNASITIGYSSPNITLQVTGGSTSVLTLTGNTGVATPLAGNINVITSGTTVKFVGSGDTLTQDFFLTNLLIGSPGTTITSGNLNVSLGRNAGAQISSGSSNTCLGYVSGTSITTGSQNTTCGTSAGSNINQGSNNSAFGNSALLTSSGSTDRNTAIGSGALGAISTGSNNIGLGYLAGQSLTTSDSSNIDIGNVGTPGDNNVIRIGTQGSGSGQQLQTHIAGVINTVSGRVVKITSPGAYPYTTLTTDYVILVDTSSARTITPLAAPVTGTTYRIKDSVGSAAANNITITPSGKNIDGAASYVINNNYGSVDIVYNGTEWNKF